MLLIWVGSDAGSARLGESGWCQVLVGWDEVILVKVGY